MNHIIACLIAVVLISTVSLNGPVGTTRAASSTTTNYSGTLLSPRNGSKVAGTIALMTSGGQTTVAITAEGLKPNTRHTISIIKGSCATMTSAAPYKLPQIIANTMGEAHAGGMLLTSSAPAAGYSVAIYNTTSTSTVLSCGTLHHPTMVVDVPHIIGTAVHGIALMTEPAPVSGNKVTTGTEIIEYATGMTPGAVYPTHVHAGLCDTQAPVKYALLDLVADAQGHALSGSGITDMVPMSGVSIHIHAPSWSMVACGNIGAPTPRM